MSCIYGSRYKIINNDRNDFENKRRGVCHSLPVDTFRNIIAVLEQLR